MKEMKNYNRETNPFEDPEVAEQWIRSVEGEKGMIRDKEIYPLLREWASDVKHGVLVEIGSGQGVCSEHLGTFDGTYVGVEPSELLVKRGEELYGAHDRVTFLIGNAYELPVDTESADGVFSVNVWFHLADLSQASKELSRILKPGAPFNIITTNPDSYDVWKEFYEDYHIEGKLLTGKVNVPVTPMSRNDFYMHTREEILDALTHSGLQVTPVATLGTMSRHPQTPIFVSIQGVKL